MTNPVVAAVAFVVVLAATPLMIVTARRTGIVDRPGALKPQKAAVPYLGGVPVLTGIAVGAALARPLVLIPLAGATALGVADDRFDLSPLVRLIGQLAVGATVVLACPIHLPGPAALVIVAVTVLLINGVNLLDGLDTLAAGVVAVAGVGFAVLIAGPERQLAVALVAALGGFLVFNRPPARIYLGDGGSYLLGTALAVLLALSWAPGVSLERGVAALALVALPAAEVAFTVVRRLRGHRPLMAGDRGHPYDRLVANGWPPMAASSAYIGTEGVLVAGAVTATVSTSVAVALAVDGGAAALLLCAGALTGAMEPEQDVPA